jgi:hypothetical protein
MSASAGDADWREIAWNGIRFETPAEWLPARIGRRHLLLEDSQGPAMEIRWEPVRGRFSHAAQLKRMNAGGRRSKVQVAAADLSAAWAAALKPFEASGFSWEGGSLTGRGAILYCPACRQASLLQFFQREPATRQTDAARVLASFRDHPSGNWGRWALFDLRAQIPLDFQLQRHGFVAGRFELGFKTGGLRLWLYRWAPAATLLEKADLADFAQQRIGFPGGAPVRSRWAGGACVEWSDIPSSGKWWWARVKAKYPCRWLRLWHLEEKNRILGVRCEGSRPADPDLVDRVCSTYEVV